MYGIDTYKKLSRPPKEALREIKGGRLSGKSDINPQWRYTAMTETFGLCGVGWKYAIDRLWTEQGTDGQVFAWAQISLYVKDGDKWSDPIPGVGGNFLLEKETAKIHNNDEAYKMSITDALGTALKMIGVAADVYSGAWDGAKYKDQPAAPAKTTPPTKPLDEHHPVGTPAIDGLKQRARDIQKALNMPDDVYIAILCAHGAKIVNGKPDPTLCDYGAVVNELKERQRNAMDPDTEAQIGRIFDGVTA